MTIAAGFVCSDGLLFASDTLYSGTFQSLHGRKFWIIKGFGDAVVVFGGAGTVRGLKRTRDEIANRARPTDRFGIVTEIEQALATVDALLKPANGERTEALIGIRIGTDFWLYENEVGSSILSVVNGNSQCVGAPFALGMYFAQSLFRSNMTIEWTKVIAAHLVKQVKTYCPGWCGGRTNLIVLPQVGQPHSIDSPEDIDALESRLRDLENVMQLVLPNDKSNDKNVLDQRFVILKKTIQDLQREYVTVTLTGVGSIGLTGQLSAVLISASGTTEPPLPLREAAKATEQSTQPIPKHDQKDPPPSPE